MRIGIRQRLVFLIFFGLFVTMSLIGTYRYFMEKRAIMASTGAHGEETCKLMAELATPLLLTSDFGGLHYMAQNFMHTPDAQEVTISDAGGRQLVRAAAPSLEESRIVVGPFPVLSDQTKLGEIRIAVYPADLDTQAQGLQCQRRDRAPLYLYHPCRDARRFRLPDHYATAPGTGRCAQGRD